MPLATGADLVARYDARRLADLVSDAGVRVDHLTVAAHPNTAVALDDATALILAAARVAARYAESDLTGSTLAKRLCCDLAFGLLTGRRAYGSELQKLAPQYFAALDQLELLRRGERLFDTGGDAHADAGLPQSHQIDPFASGPNLLSSNERFFGVRLPPLFNTFRSE